MGLMDQEDQEGLYVYFIVLWW